MRGDNFVSNCRFGTSISNASIPLQSIVQLSTTNTTTLSEYPGS
jgi:hypothetical protein